MQLRTYRGKTIGEALAAVKRELGPDALIVHTRSFKIGGVLGMGAREEIEILASAPVPPHPASTRSPASPARPARPPQSASTGRAIAERLSAAYNTPSVEEPPRTSAPVMSTRAPQAALTSLPVPPPAAKLPSATARPSATPRSVPAATVMQVRQRSAVPPAVADVARAVIDTPTPSPVQLRDELGAIKTMVAQLISAGAAASVPSSASAADDPLAEWYLKLLSNAVSRELADRIVADVRRGAAAFDRNPRHLRDAFRARIAAYLPAANDPLTLPSDGEPRPRTVALVGATGVGKTTTIAKLAAHAKLSHDARIGVITCDTNRIGAIEQLRTYTDILNVPFRVAATPDEMLSAREALAETDLLLIDTPGLSPRDDQGIAGLADVLRSARVSEIHLALPASGAEASLLATCRAFAPLAPSRLLFTKLDEAVTYGVILSVAAQVNTALSYMTTGPRIPEQIETTDSSRLADLIAA